MTARRVLVVDDDPTIAEAVSTRLRSEGFHVSTASDGPSAVAACEAESPDLVVLDVMLPGFDGLEVCRRIQAKRDVPVLMLTARSEENDLLVGLGVGADDYLSKPFSMRELVARTHALLRRAERAHRSEQLDLGPLHVDLEARRVSVAGVDVHLTRTEFDLLAHLIVRPGAALSRDALLEGIWGWGEGAGSRTVDSHIKSLRRKIGADLIRTVHGIGYAFEVPR